jgi:hypothetical protein
MVAGGSTFSLGVVGGSGESTVRPAWGLLGVLGAVVVSWYDGQLADETDEELMK